MTLFWGHSPSKKNRSKAPFLGSPSEKRLRSWMRDLNEPDWLWANMSPTATPRLTNLTELDLKRIERLSKEVCDRGGKVVALGRDVRKVLERLQIEHFPLPHPSGRNRHLNDRGFVNTLLTACKEWIHDGND